MAIESSNSLFNELAAKISAKIVEAKKQQAEKPPAKVVAKKPPLKKAVAFPPMAIYPSPAPAKVSKPMVIPDIPLDQWDIQVRPYGEHSALHFQFRPKKGTLPGGVPYLKVNRPSKPAELEAITIAINSGKYTTSVSYYGSGSIYLVCTRVSLTTVEIPGAGKMEVNELANFGMNSIAPQAAIGEPEVGKVITLQEEEEANEEEDEVQF